LGFKPVSKKVSVFSDESVEYLNLPKRFVHVHLTSRWMFKCANDESMAELIDYCENELNAKVVLTSDNKENELNKLANVLKICKSEPINLGGKLSLKQTIALSKRASLFIGVDTAIMHIAAANDVPVIAFFGPSNAFEWGPWDNSLMQNGYTAQNGIQSMGKHIVYQKDWDFVPCDKEGIKEHGIEKTLMDFSDEMGQIKAKIRSNLELAQ